MTLMMELKRQRREGYSEGEADGIAKGMAKGMAKGQSDERMLSIRNLMKNLQLTVQQAMDALGIPVAEREKYAALV